MEKVEKTQNENSFPTKIKKQRDCIVDLIRILACLIVIGVHVNNLTITTLDKTRIFWGIILGDGVTIFFIIMGFFLFKNKSFKTLLKKTCIGILLPAFILLLVSELLFPWISNSTSFIECIKNLKLDYSTILKNILSWTPSKTTSHLWYIFSYFKIILMFPILRWIVKDKNASKYVIFVTFGLMIYTDLKVFFNPQYQLTPFYFVEIPMMYAILGYEIYQRKTLIKNNKKVTIIATLIAICIQIIRYIMQYKLLEKNIANCNYVFWNTSFSCIFATSIIIIFLSLEIKNLLISKIISFLGQRTFGIYLVHLMILLFLDTRGLSINTFKLLGYTFETSGYMSFTEEFAYISIKTLVIFVISLAITSIIYFFKYLISKGLKRIQKFW